MDKAASDTGKSDPTSSDVGTLLCATRMRMGKDLQHVAQILHIRYNYLVAMEDGRYEDLPGQAYAIGFVRAYADHLGLDGNEIVRRYKKESSGIKDRSVFEFPVPTPDSGVPSGALILVAIIMGMMVYGAWYAVAGSDRSAVQVIQEVPDRLNAMLNPPPAVDAPETQPAADSDTDTAPPDADAQDVPVASEAPATESQLAALPAAPVSTDVVDLRAKSDVWITLKTPENPERTQFLQKGEVFRAPDGGGGMTLVTGKPSDLDILVNGEVMPALDESTFARGVLLDPARLKASPADGAHPPAAPPSGTN